MVELLQSERFSYFRKRWHHFAKWWVINPDLCRLSLLVYPRLCLPLSGGGAVFLQEKRTRGPCKYFLAKIHAKSVCEGLPLDPFFLTKTTHLWQKQKAKRVRQARTPSPQKAAVYNTTGAHRLRRMSTQKEHT